MFSWKHPEQSESRNAFYLRRPISSVRPHRDPPVQARGLFGAIQDVASDNQVIHFGVDEAAVSIVRGADDWLATDVERGIDQHAAAGGALEAEQ
jgi:hypothetical protein